MKTNHVRYLFKLVLYSMSMLAFALSMTGNAYAQDPIPNPHFTIFPEWEWFDGMDWPDGPVTITVTGKPECELEMGSSGGFFNGGFPEGCDVAAGNEVTFTAGETVRTHIVQNLVITNADIVTNIVGGMADSDAVIQVWPHETELLEDTANALGDWQVDFTGIYDLMQGTCGRAQIAIGDNATAVEWCAPKPWLTAFPKNEAVEGWEWPDGATVYLTIDNAPGLEWEQIAAVTSWGDPRTFVRFEFGDHYDLQVGDTVTLTSNGIVRSHQVINLSVDEVDGEADAVTGTAGIGAVVQVWPHGYDQYLIEATASDGTWLADFGAAGFHQIEETGGRAQIVVNGNATAVDWSVPPPPPSPHFTVFPEWEWFDGLDWPDGAQVSIIVAGKPECKTLSVESWDGFFNGGFPEGCDVAPGDEVTFTHGETVRTHTVRNLAVTSIDADDDTVSGTATEGETVFVWPHETGDQLEDTANSLGEWSVDFTSLFDIVPGSNGRSEIRDEDGNASAVDWTAPWPSTWRDEFDGSLAEGWYWFDENPEKWSLTERPGYLRIYASPYENGGENRLLRPIAQGDFMIKTRVLFEPDSNFQFAGLYIYQDEENLLALGRAFCDVPDACIGNGLYFDHIADGNWIDGNFATQVDNPSEAYLRLERRGEMVRGLYSADGVYWIEMGIHWIPPDFQVNAVGIIAKGDADKSDEDIPADFDFFELTEGWGFLPEGYHDYDQGDVPSWACNAGGWAADPDDRAMDLKVEIIVDEQPVDSLPAGDFRQDLLDAGVCMDGNCSFSSSLWEIISSYEEHTVTTWAMDNSSGEWVLLSSSPKTLTCRTFDIYAFDPLTGEIEQVTFLTDADEYNPSWSPNGKKIAHHVVHSDGSAGFYLTDVRTGVSTQVEGVQNSGGAVFSPNGKWIAFHMPGENGSTNMYIMPVEGGEIELIRENAQYPDWAPNGKRLVFQDTADGSIRSIPVDGGKGYETLIAESGYSPAWSPDGCWIAYEVEGDIWKVSVNVQGTVFGEPVQLTSGLLGEGHPTWSADSQTIVFHAGMTPDYDLWSMPAAGGAVTWLNGAPGVGDYDPASARNSDLIAYASASPEGQAARNWGVAFIGDVRTWNPGEHSYHMQFAYTVPEMGGGVTEEISFTVSDDAPGYAGIVLLRPHALRARVGEECAFIDLINPDQPARFHFAWVTDDVITYSEAQAFFGSMTVSAYWVEDMSEDLIRQDVFSWPSVDWAQYICLFTGSEP